MTRLSCTSLWSVKCGILLFLFYFSFVSQPTDSAVGLYDAKIKLSRQSMIEIQKLLEGEDSWRTGALDNAISQILLDLKPHDYQAWKWRFEDTFCIELDTVLKVMLSSAPNISVFVVNVPKFAFFPGQMFPVSMFQLGLGVLLIVAIINTSLWSRVAWCVQLRRLFAVCFLISIIWNWFYMYKVKKKLQFFFFVDPLGQTGLQHTLFIILIRLLLLIAKKTWWSWKESVKNALGWRNMTGMTIWKVRHWHLFGWIWYLTLPLVLSLSLGIS